MPNNDPLTSSPRTKIFFFFFFTTIFKNFFGKAKKTKNNSDSSHGSSEKKERKNKKNYTYNLILTDIIQYLLVSLKEKRSIKLMYAKIKQFGAITPGELQSVCGNMSISTYNKLKPYLMDDYEGRIEYVRQRKLFVDLNPDATMGLAIQEVMEKFHS